jgi:hypothetical protein
LIEESKSEKFKDFPQCLEKTNENDDAKNQKANKKQETLQFTFDKDNVKSNSFDTTPTNSSSLNNLSKDKEDDLYSSKFNRVSNQPEMDEITKYILKVMFYL